MHVDTNGDLAPDTLLPGDSNFLPIIAQTRGASTRAMLDQFMSASSLQPSIVVETDLREALVPLVLAGAGAALLPRPMAVDPRAWRLLAIFIATLVGIIAKPLPMSAMAVIGIACALATRTLTIVEALTGFSNVTLWLVISAFFFAAGFVSG